MARTNDSYLSASLLAFAFFLVPGFVVTAEQNAGCGTGLPESENAALLYADIRGVTEISPHGFKREMLVFSEDAITDLVSIGEMPVVISGWPVAPGDRHAVRFRLIQVYAPNAKVWGTDGVERWEVSRSTRVRLAGVSLVDPAVRVLISVDQQNASLRGWVSSEAGAYQITETTEKGVKRIQIADSEDLNLEHDSQPRYGCAFDETPWRDMRDDSVVDLVAQKNFTKSSPLRQIVIAVDTDNEFNWKRFSNDTSDAEDWIADLFAAMTTLYESDLNLRILKGDTTLRLDPDAPNEYDNDPYSIVGSPANESQLDEFGDYWAANMGSVDRTFAMLLSGKSSNSHYSSGIAWVDGYCEKQSYAGGYSVSQIYTASYIPIWNNMMVIAHEIGHNLGSQHTHCYSPPIDNCYACEVGCFSGTVSCPSGGQGTLMSYCHVQTTPESCSATCGDNEGTLHPTVSILLDSYVTGHTPSCVSIVDDTSVFSDGFETNNTNAWSATVS